MITFLQNITLPQAVVLAVAAWLLTHGIGTVAWVVRRLRGKPEYADCCEHCERVEGLQGQIGVHERRIDTLAELVDQHADESMKLHAQVQELAAAQAVAP